MLFDSMLFNNAQRWSSSDFDFNDLTSTEFRLRGNYHLDFYRHSNLGQVLES